MSSAAGARPAGPVQAIRPPSMMSAAPVRQLNEPAGSLITSSPMFVMSVLMRRSLRDRQHGAYRGVELGRDILHQQVAAVLYDVTAAGHHVPDVGRGGREQHTVQHRGGRARFGA